MWQDSMDDPEEPAMQHMVPAMQQQQLDGVHQSLLHLLQIRAALQRAMTKQHSVCWWMWCDRVLLRYVGSLEGVIYTA